MRPILALETYAQEVDAHLAVLGLGDQHHFSLLEGVYLGREGAFAGHLPQDHFLGFLFALFLLGVEVCDLGL